MGTCFYQIEVTNKENVEIKGKEKRSLNRLLLVSGLAISRFQGKKNEQNLKKQQNQILRCITV